MNSIKDKTSIIGEIQDPWLKPDQVQIQETEWSRKIIGKIQDPWLESNQVQIQETKWSSKPLQFSILSFFIGCSGVSIFLLYSMYFMALFSPNAIDLESLLFVLGGLSVSIFLIVLGIGINNGKYWSRVAYVLGVPIVCAIVYFFLGFNSIQNYGLFAYIYLVISLHTVYGILIYIFFTISLYTTAADNYISLHSTHKCSRK